MSNLVPMDFCSDCQDHDVNLLSISETIDMGTPCSCTISLMLVMISFSILLVSMICRKCADLVNRSTITQMVSRPPVVLDNLVMKSFVNAPTSTQVFSVFVTNLGASKTLTNEGSNLRFHVRPPV